ncbi:MAG: N-acyl-D-amino-acid deacylase family protein [Candidatus Bipolaricaulota bacterium]
MNFDVLLKSCRVYDGTGNPWYTADVGIKEGRIAAIGRREPLDEDADQVVDVEGQVLCPGFIDIHTHSDANFLADPKASSKLFQGVTTELAGNCGVSAVPFSSEMNFSEAIYEAIDEIDWDNFRQFFARLEENGVPLNLATLAGHGSLRNEIMGFEDREPSTSELDQMKSLLDEYMEQGVFGLSTGLYYAPGSYASTEEVIELAKVVSDHGGLYASHIRNEGKCLLESVEEAIEIGEKAQVPVEISHHKAVGQENWGKVTDSLARIEEARNRGIEVTCDQYPYNASSTSLSSLLPRWAQKGGRKEWLKRLEDKQSLRKIKSEMGSTNENRIDWSAVYIVEFPGDEGEDIIGKNVAEIAEDRETEATQTAVDLLLESEGQARKIHFAISKDDIETVMSKPFVMTGSDGSSLRVEGPLSSGKPHPRSYGTFPRVLGKYVREKETLSLEDAIRKMTSFPAQKIGLRNKGQVKEGMDADLVVFSPDQIEDKATFQDPHQYPVGINYVLVNGRIAAKNGQLVDHQAGDVLKF